jgi:serine/threonine protein kinase/tetratricopeptide (TPR) repeat protein
VLSRKRQAKTAKLQLMQEDPVEALTTRLLEEMNAAWQGGEWLRAEDLLSRHPEAGTQTEVGVRIVYEEVCLREESGQAIDPAEVLRRFPHWRDQLEVLLDCHDLMRPPPAPVFPEVGEALDGLLLQAELGRGRQGRVSLATQPGLADRPVVVKLTPRDGSEHSSLARLQHTHIVPLYWVQDFPDRHLRLLGMPYLGGATLAQVLDGLRDRPISQRSGVDLLEALDAVQAQVPLRLPGDGPARRLLGQISWEKALCWVGACLAEALDYAHQRGLVHLDLKPSNVLLASDGQPLLLDFHLAREPLLPGQTAPDWFGGTPAYMAPEQRLAWEAVAAGQPLSMAVDGRADIYALGLLLDEALGSGVRQNTGATDPRSGERGYGNAGERGGNPHISPGLADVIDKCLAVQPSDRYGTAKELAGDLRNHLEDRPLEGVRNRNLLERWRKWRRRRPLVLPLVLLLAVFVVMMGGLGLLVWSWDRLRVEKDRAQAQESLQDGQRLLDEGRFARAVERLKFGHDLAATMAGGTELERDLEEALHRARRGEAAQSLHEVVERLGFAVVDPSLPPREARDLEAKCRSLWERRHKLLRSRGAGLGEEAEQRLQTDLLDLAIIGTTLRVRRAGEREEEQARREALTVLTEAEAALGPSPVLEQERRTCTAALGSEQAPTRLSARTVWEHYALGRSFLLAGTLDQAADEFESVLATRPQHFWSQFYLGVCCYRRKRYDQAVEAFGACVALSPQSAECYHNRALASAARDDTQRALRDCNRALELSPNLAAAVYNRGLLHHRAGRYAEAEADLRRALERNPENTAARALLEQVRKKLAAGSRP